MTPEEFFHAAVEITDPAERAALLDRECAGDPALRAEVASLLAASRDTDGFMATEGLPEAPALPASEKPGARIDRYKLLEQIGEGGFGMVWLAEQEAPVRRRVALKIIKPGMDTRKSSPASRFTWCNSRNTAFSICT